MILKIFIIIQRAMIIKKLYIHSMKFYAACKKNIVVVLLSEKALMQIINIIWPHIETYIYVHIHIERHTYTKFIYKSCRIPT